MPQCKRCSTTLKWKKPYTKGDRPVNLNGTPHSCDKSKPSEMVGKGYSKKDYYHCDLCSSEYGWIPLNDPDAIYNHKKTFHPNDEQRTFDFFKV